MTLGSEYADDITPEMWEILSRVNPLTASQTISPHRLIRSLPSSSPPPPSFDINTLYEHSSDDQHSSSEESQQVPTQDYRQFIDDEAEVEKEYPDFQQRMLDNKVPSSIAVEVQLHIQQCIEGLEEFPDQTYLESTFNLTETQAIDLLADIESTSLEEGEGDFVASNDSPDEEFDTEEQPDLTDFINDNTSGLESGSEYEHEYGSGEESDGENSGTDDADDQSGSGSEESDDDEEFE